MKKFRNIFAIMALGLAAAACSDEVVGPAMEEVPEGYLRLNINVEAPTVVTSRSVANENGVKELFVAMFKADGSDIISTQFITVTGNNIASINLPIPTEYKLQDKQVAVVANANEYLRNWVDAQSGARSLTSLGSFLMSADDAGYFYMSGKSGLIKASENSKEVSLYRLKAKLSIYDNLSSGADYAVTGFELKQGATAAALNVPWSDTGEANVFAAYQPTQYRSDYASGGVGDDNPVYSYPARVSTTQSTDSAFLIVKARNKRSNVESYYRVNLWNKQDGKKVDLYPNHWYKVTVDHIYGDGFSSPDDAAQHPDNGSIQVTIYDVAANVMSMISDGQRELGATRQLNLNTEQAFRVKTYSNISSAEEDYSNIKVEVVEGDGWLEVTNADEPEEVTDEDDEYSKLPGETLTGQEEEQKGRLWKYTLAMKSGVTTYNDLEATVRVSWQGLERDVKVFYSADFAPQDVMDVELIMKSRNQEISLQGYWKFLAGEGQNTSTNSNITSYTDETKIPKLQGNQPADMGEKKARNEGLHFNMPLGGDNPYSYSYKLKIKGTADSVKIVTSGDDAESAEFFAQQNFTLTKEGDDYMLTLNYSTVDFTYATGTIKFQVWLNGGGYRELPLKLYHTGIFDHVAGTGYLYYEVVYMGGRHWLDRNIGATSCLNYVYYPSTGRGYGNEGAKGNYVQIGRASEKYSSDPTFYSKGSLHIPEGFHIPNKTEFDGVRVSANLHTSTATENGTAVQATYYRTGTLAGDIYFPKTGFMDADAESNIGSDATGYYWTQTTANGLEKEQIGQWVKALTFSGSANSYINAQLEVNNNSTNFDSKYYTKGYQMPIRVVAGISPAAEESHSIDFYVTGATHAYLYSKQDDPLNSGLFTFPGKGITTDSGNNLTKMNRFSYNSTFKAEELYVLFVRMDSNGKITLLSQNGTTNGGDTDLSSARGWPVQLKMHYKFVWSGSSWSLTQETSPTYKTAFAKGDKVRLIWYKRWNWGQGDVHYQYAHMWNHGADEWRKWDGDGPNDTYWAEFEIQKDNLTQIDTQIATENTDWGKYDWEATKYFTDATYFEAEDGTSYYIISVNV